MQENSAGNSYWPERRNNHGGLRGFSKTPSLARVGAVINVEGVLIGVSDVAHWTLTSTVR